RVTYTDLGVYSSRNALLDLSGSLPADYASGFTPALYAAVSRDDKPYGVPHHTDTSMVLVNDDAAAAAGLGTLPQAYDEAWTWDEFKAALDKLKAAAKPSTYATGLNLQLAGAYRWLNFVGQAGGRLLDESLRAPAIDSPAGLEALRFTQGLYSGGYVPRSTSAKGEYVGDLFTAGTLASVVAGDFLLADFEKGASFDFSATFLPVKEQATAELGGNALVAAAATPRKEQAAKFLQFAASEEQMAKFCGATSVLPTRTSIDAADIDYAVRPDLMALFLEQSKAITPEIVQQVTVPEFNEVNAALVERLEQAFNGGRDAAEVLAGLAGDIEQVFAS
ncbi:extracellular solute-binding protein, partial [Motilibacter deserti]